MRDRVNRVLTTLPRELKLFAGLVIGLWFFSVSYATLVLWRGSGTDTYRWIYYDHPAFDFWDYLERSQLLHKPDFFSAPGYPWYYPAPTMLLLQPLYAIARRLGGWAPAYVVYLVIAICGALFMALKLAQALEHRGIRAWKALSFALISALFSWPLYFAMQRGNIEALTWMIFAASLVAYRRERWYTAAILLGIVGAFKFYPAICFALFLRPFRLKAIGAGVLAMAVATLAGLRYLQPQISVAFHGVAAGMQHWVQDYAQGYGPNSAAYDHSLYEILKVSTINLHPAYATFTKEYLVVAGALTCLVFFGRVLRMPQTNQVLFLVIAMISLPPASFDYTLANLYVAWAWMVLALASAHQRGTSIRASGWVMLLFGLVMGPETFITWNGITQAGLLKGILLLLLLVTCAVVPLVEEKNASAVSSKVSLA